MDIAKIISTFIDKIKIILWPIFLLSIALTFMPEKWITHLSINDLVNKNKAWISITLLISSAFVLVELFLLVKNAFTRHFAKREARKNMKNRLLNLSDTQNFIVHHLFAENTPSGLYLNVMHPEVNDLANKKIIYRSSNIGQLTAFAYSLTPIAYKILSQSDSVTQKIVDGYSEENIDNRAFGKTYY